MRNLFPPSLGALVFASLLLSQTGAKTETAATIVFVCEHGAAKSVIAATEFNRLAEEKGLPERAISRGTNLDAEFAPNVVAGLKKDGLPVPTGKPVMLTSAEVATAERVVTLGCTLPVNLKPADKLEDWADIASPRNYEASRAGTLRHIQQLVNELAAKGSTK